MNLQQECLKHYGIIVVNCFRSLYLWVNLQQALNLIDLYDCCELLSFFVPLGEFTAPPDGGQDQTCCELLSFFVPLGEFTAICTRCRNI